jgi:mono/diheme cytochrome c family protein
VIAPDLPLARAPQLANYGEFEQFIRNPRMQNGLVGAMPAFTASTISDEEVKALYDYIVHVIEKPGPSQVPPTSPGHGAN